MGFKVILTPQSLVDLEDIVTFIARDNPEPARSFGHQLIDRALSVSSFPERGRIVPELGLPAVREIIYGAYRIIYEVSGEAVSFCASGTALGASRRLRSGKTRKFMPKKPSKSSYDYSLSCALTKLA